MKISALGTEYDFIETTGRDDPRLERNDGWCGNYGKVILVETDVFVHDEGGDMDLTRKERKKYIRRHELVHSFFNESGLDDYSSNEQLVTWIARQFPKMLKAFEEMDAI